MGERESIHHVDSAATKALRTLIADCRHHLSLYRPGPLAEAEAFLASLTSEFDEPEPYNVSEAFMFDAAEDEPATPRFSERLDRRKAAEPAAWAYEFHEFGDVWKRHVILNRPGGGANPPTKHHGSEIRDVLTLYALAPTSPSQESSRG